MKLFLYVVLGFVAMGASLLLIAGDQAPASKPIILIPFVLLFAIPPLGTFWMMYMSIRYEEKPFPFLLLSLLPFTFLWYYFEKERPRKLKLED